MDQPKSTLPRAREAVSVGVGEGASLARAEALYELGRKRVAGRPPWSKLDPADPYDMGMRAEAIRQAEAGQIAVDPVDAAEVAFLADLAAGRKPPSINAGLDWNRMSREDRNAAREHGRIHNSARQRARVKGRAFWQSPRWSITDDGRAWLAARADRVPA